jgi:hypothetical protein
VCTQPVSCDAEGDCTDTHGTDYCDEALGHCRENCSRIPGAGAGGQCQASEYCDSPSFGLPNGECHDIPGNGEPCAIAGQSDYLCEPGSFCDQLNGVLCQPE